MISIFDFISSSSALHEPSLQPVDVVGVGLGVATVCRARTYILAKLRNNKFVFAIQNHLFSCQNVTNFDLVVMRS